MRQARSLHDLSRSKPELRTDATEREGGLWLYDVAVHLKQRVRKKVDRSALGFRIDYQVASLR
jgi:hypothetical protein